VLALRCVSTSALKWQGLERCLTVGHRHACEKRCQRGDKHIVSSTVHSYLFQNNAICSVTDGPLYISPSLTYFPLPLTSATHAPINSAASSHRYRKRAGILRTPVEAADMETPLDCRILHLP